ncbi:porin family protein [Dinghuibacter silviterrae]|uniref:Outer membrane protein with beta-barrel domain n=1 Tax=Dinghuibacter silviterrae TaxID=1539049 RepID=A0A4R8DT94_9BACT|nr:porin family protein [Dinghuibacter silviterrae]TDX00371.1 outer membrane protein with beta-barrel domain [Dinghuibacter silviterrae]
MRTCILAALLLVSANGFSQSFVKQIASHLEFGLKAGGNYSNFYNANFSTDPIYGFHAGATMAFKITKNFLIQEDILFSTEGAKGTSGTNGTSGNINLYYMSVPILLKVRTNTGFYIEAGAQSNYKVKEDVPGWDKSAGDYAQKLDFGAVGGIGYQSPMGLGIGVRYVYGLSNVSNNTVNGSFKNQVAQASIFYVF